VTFAAPLAGWWRSVSVIAPREVAGIQRLFKHGLAETGDDSEIIRVGGQL